MVFRKYFVCFILIFSLLGTTHSLFADNAIDYSPTSSENTPGTPGSKTDPAFSESNAAAMHWLNLIDQYQFSGSWLDAGSLLRDVVSQDQWVAAMEGTRKRYGNVRTRKIKNFTRTRSLSFGTMGDFMVITYHTEFSKKANLLEQIVMMTEGPLKLWKVVHYQIGK
jgi:hypothetical protein